MKDIQRRVREFSNKNQLSSSPEYQLLDTISELGEVAKEILKMTNYGREKLVVNEEIKGELGDVLYSLITVANSFNIDLEDAFFSTMDKYERRIKKGSMGSENE